MPRSPETNPNPTGVKPFPASEQVRAALLEIVRADSVSQLGKDARRTEPRFPVEDTMMVLKIEHPGGGVSRGEAMLLDMSSRGLCGIWPGYVHVRTNCVVSLTSKSQDLVEVRGQIRWCRFVQGRFHAIGLHLEKQVEPRDFVDPRVWAEYATVGSDQQTAPLSGSVLYLQPDQLHRDYLQMVLRETSVKMEFASTTGESLDYLRTSGADLVIIEVSQDPADVLDFVRTARREQYAGPILVLAMEGQQLNEAQLIQGGANRVLVRPIPTEVLQDVIRKMMQAALDPASGTSPIHSSLPHVMKVADWVDRYVRNIRGSIPEIRQHAADGNVDATRLFCANVSATGESYGFGLLTSAGRAAVRAIDATASTEEAMPQIRALIRIIERLRCPGDASPPGEGATSERSVT